jgi:uncharacterized cupin superfamily protein
VVGLPLRGRGRSALRRSRREPVLVTTRTADVAYHHEAGQEDFLVLRGECLLVIEGEERRLEAWDFVHCPPRTAHTIVAGSQPALVLGVGARKEKGSARYPIEPVAIAHGAGLPDESATVQEVYASFGEPTPGPAPEIFSHGGDGSLSP